MVSRKVVVIGAAAVAVLAVGAAGTAWALNRGGTTDVSACRTWNAVLADARMTTPQEHERIVDGWSGSDHPDLRGAGKALQRSHEAREQGDAGRVSDEWASAVTLGGSGCGAIGQPVDYLPEVPAVEAAPLVPTEPAAPTEPYTWPAGSTVGITTIGEPSTTLAVDVMWTRCVLRAPNAVDLDYDGVGEDAAPSAGNRLCLTKFKVENTGLNPAPFLGYLSTQLVTDSGVYDSSGVAYEMAAASLPVEGEDKDSALGLNPHQVGYSFSGWEVPDRVTVQAVQFEDGQRLAVEVERLDTL